MPVVPVIIGYEIPHKTMETWRSPGVGDVIRVTYEFIHTDEAKARSYMAGLKIPPLRLELPLDPEIVGVFPLSRLIQEVQ